MFQITYEFKMEKNILLKRVGQNLDYAIYKMLTKF